jgi:protease-4
MNVSYARYLASLRPPVDDSDPNIAVVTAAGTIVDGQAPIGVSAGGDTIAALLRRAREDDNVKAVVLRVDSPGGSAFASDIIRDELIAIKKAGKPLIASMGSLAASGGYWISAPADEIWAAPTTITGSIGIFGLTFTFENAAAELGVFTDGVGTTALTPALAAGFGPLPEEYAEILQQSIEDGYDRFLSVVGEGRGLDKDYVDSVGQGRVWIGARARELRLVDELGDIDAAIAAAAARANLENYDVVEFVDELTPFERLLGSFSSRVLALSGGEIRAAQRTSIVRKWIAQAEKHLAFFGEFNDPNAAYARCLACGE